MRAFGWTVWTLVFADELLVIAVFGVWGRGHSPWASLGWLLVWLLPLAAMGIWYLLASPKAPYGGPLVRPLTKVVVFGAAVLALVDAGHPGWAAALLGFSVVVNALAEIPGVKALVAG